MGDGERRAATTDGTGTACTSRDGAMMTMARVVVVAMVIITIVRGRGRGGHHALAFGGGRTAGERRGRVRIHFDRAHPWTGRPQDRSSMHSCSDIDVLERESGICSRGGVVVGSAVGHAGRARQTGAREMMSVRRTPGTVVCMYVCSTSRIKECPTRRSTSRQQQKHTILNMQVSNGKTDESRLEDFLLPSPTGAGLALVSVELVEL